VLEAATKALSAQDRYFDDPRFLRMWMQYVSGPRGGGDQGAGRVAEGSRGPRLRV
jgi:hypothetical protein